MPEGQSLTDELLDMARRPESFSKFDLGEMLLVAATEILKLQEFGSGAGRQPAPTCPVERWRSFRPRPLKPN
jgi:hypothetical protein